jgi:hypothetical protein
MRACLPVWTILAYKAFSDTNLYGYVYNDPLRFVDPFGLGPLPPWLKAVLKALPDVIPKPEGTGELVGDIVGGVGGGALATFLIPHPVSTVAGAIVGAHVGGQIGKSLLMIHARGNSTAAWMSATRISQRRAIPVSQSLRLLPIPYLSCL